MGLTLKAMFDNRVLNQSHFIFSIILLSNLMYRIYFLLALCSFTAISNLYSQQESQEMVTSLHHGDKINPKVFEKFLNVDFPLAIIAVASAEDCVSCTLGLSNMSKMSEEENIPFALSILGKNDNYAAYFLRTNSLKGIALSDAEKTIASLFQMKIPPAFFLIDRFGTIIEYDKCGGSAVRTEAVRQKIKEYRRIAQSLSQSTPDEKLQHPLFLSSKKIKFPNNSVPIIGALRHLRPIQDKAVHYGVDFTFKKICSITNEGIFDTVMNLSLAQIDYPLDFYLQQGEFKGQKYDAVILSFRYVTNCNVATFYSFEKKKKIAEVVFEKVSEKLLIDTNVIKPMPSASYRPFMETDSTMLFYIINWTFHPSVPALVRYSLHTGKILSFFGKRPMEIFCSEDSLREIGSTPFVLSSSFQIPFSFVPKVYGQVNSTPIQISLPGTKYLTFDEMKRLPAEELYTQSSSIMNIFIQKTEPIYAVLYTIPNPISEKKYSYGLAFLNSNFTLQSAYKIDDKYMDGYHIFPAFHDGNFSLIRTDNSEYFLDSFRYK